MLKHRLSQVARYRQYFLSHPRVIVAVFVLISLFLSIGITKVQFVNQFERDLPEVDPIFQTNRRLEEVFGEKDLLMVALVNDGGIYNTGTLAKLFEMSRELEDMDGVVPGSVKSLCTVKNISGSDSALDIGPFIEEPPDSEEGVAQIRAAVEQNALAQGRLVSLDGTATIIRGHLEAGHDVEHVYRELHALKEKYSGPERIHITGDTIVDYEVTSSMRKDIAWLFPVALILAVGILFGAFRRFASVIIPCVAVVATVGASFGLMGFFGMPVTVVGSILPVVIVAVVSAYGIHIVNAFANESVAGGTGQDILRRTMRLITWPVVISAVTSAIGFGSLVIFKIRSIHDFGIILAGAILFGLCASVIFIPSFFAILPHRGSAGRAAQSSRFIDWLILSFYEFVERHRKGFVTCAALCLLLSVLAGARLKVGLEPAKLFPEGHPTRTSLDVFNEKLGGSTCFNVMVETEDADGIMEPGVLRRMDEFQRFAESQDHVGYATSFVDVVKRLHLILGETEESGEQLPNDKSGVAQYLLLYSMSGDPSDFEDIVDYDYRRAKLLVMLNTYDDAEHIALYHRLKEKAESLFGNDARVEFGGRAMILLAQDRYIVVGKIQNIICSLIIVWIICTLYFRSLTGGILSIIPLAVSTVYTFGVMGLLGIRLNVATAMTTSIAVGVGVDFAVHYIHRFREEYARSHDEREAVRNALLTAGKGIIYNTLSVSLGFFVFMGSRFQTLRDFGWLIALTMVTCAAGSLLFLPPLICAVRPYFIYGKEPQYVRKALSIRSIRLPAMNLEVRLDSIPWLKSRLGKMFQYL